jgi:hypothetical protein
MRYLPAYVTEGKLSDSELDEMANVYAALLV